MSSRFPRWRRGQSVAIAEMVPRLSQRRDRLQVQGRKDRQRRASRRRLPDAPRRSSSAVRPHRGEKNDDCVQVRAGEPTDPVIGMIGSRVSEDLRPSRHSLPKLFREAWPANLVRPERLQPVPGKRHGDPSCVSCARRPAATASADSTLSMIPASQARPCAGSWNDEKLDSAPVTPERASGQSAGYHRTQASWLFVRSVTASDPASPITPSSPAGLS